LNKIPPLSDRLGRIAACIVPGKPLWDVGCDHGYLGLHAFGSGLCSHVNLVDRSAEVVRRLEARLSQRFPEGLPSGLNLLHRDAANQDLGIEQGSLVLAGLGPGVTLAILTRQFEAPAQDFRIVLAPDLNEERLRLSLAQRGWRLQYEELYPHTRHARQILICGRDGEAIHPFWNGSGFSRSNGLLDDYWAQRKIYYAKVRATTDEKVRLKQALQQDINEN
jgi:tRNA (adenine22-N1)-methyltransferase